VVFFGASDALLVSDVFVFPFFLRSSCATSYACYRIRPSHRVSIAVSLAGAKASFFICERKVEGEQRDRGCNKYPHIPMMVKAGCQANARRDRTDTRTGEKPFTCTTQRAT
jgi:hypothetical protein